MGVEGLKYLIFPALFFNYIFIKRIDDKKLFLYKNIQKDVMVLGFIYLLSICMISLSNNNSYINVKHIILSLMIVLILPIPILKLLEFKTINIRTIKSKLIKMFDILYCALISFITLFYFFNKNHYLNKYSFYGLFYLTFIYFLINFNKNDDSKNIKN
ncbi:hypothetical protein FQB35_14830 [Crassaminicella thermophila]|uniref:Uncharacterized protein n=1 Tax=Crassaminicella thermophila TaxID=2599308 RepID=A0A5C0SJ10_CRATE|nr:hypothetical protein [Crassaminicella thermophila]QEK13434.1 hypothetical protein FQB35_14830 [Crassaminicella thermophila]